MASTFRADRKPVRLSQGNNFPKQGVPSMRPAPQAPTFNLAEIKVTLVRKASSNSPRLEYKVIHTLDYKNAIAQVTAAQWQGYTVHSYGTDVV